MIFLNREILQANGLYTHKSCSTVIFEMEIDTLSFPN